MEHLPRAIQSLPDLANLTLQEINPNGSALPKTPVKAVLKTVPISKVSEFIKYDDLKFEKKIGHGGYKDVFKGRFKGDDVAIGVIEANKLDEQDLEDILNELEVLRYLIVFL